MHSKYQNFHVLSQPKSQSFAQPWEEVVGNSKCQRWLYLFSCFPRLSYKTHVLFLFGSVVSSLSNMSSISCLCLALLLPLVFEAPLPGNPQPPPHTRIHTSLHQDEPALKKGCCHWEIARKCPGGLHQLLSYRDVKCFKLKWQTQIQERLNCDGAVKR